MILIALTFAFLFALILTILFYFIFGLKGPWKGYKYFFLIIFLVSFAAGEWVIPAGPVAWGYYWLPALITAVLIAILLAAITPSSDNQIKKEDRAIEENDEKTTSTSIGSTIAEDKLPIYYGKETKEGVVLGALFWIFLLMLLISGIIGYLYT
jgi:hypothetical protein